MAITTLDGVIAGMRPPETIYKVGTTFEGAGLPTSLWYTTGRPGTGAAPSSGINGGAVVGNSVVGQIPRTNPSSGNAHLARFAAQAGIIGTLWLCDRLWANSGLSVTSTVLQSITPAALPARDRDGTTNGEDVLCGIEWSVAGGAGTPTVTLAYNDQSGAAQTTSLVATTTPAQGLLEIFPLVAGTTGVRGPTGLTQSLTRTSGTMHLILFRILAQVPVTTANVLNWVDFLTSGGPRIYNNSVPFLVWVPTSATATTVFGQYIETHG